MIANSHLSPAAQGTGVHLEHLEAELPGEGVHRRRLAHPGGPGQQRSVRGQLALLAVERPLGVIIVVVVVARRRLVVLEVIVGDDERVVAPVAIPPSDPDRLPPGLVGLPPPPGWSGN